MTLDTSAGRKKETLLTSTWSLMALGVWPENEHFEQTKRFFFFFFCPTFVLGTLGTKPSIWFDMLWITAKALGSMSPVPFTISSTERKRSAPPPAAAPVHFYR
jgi:hypothetical protein